ncbi:MAG: acetoin dehydrogenase [Nitrospina sp.]|nr:acetoin dehydrogenase [Nitrospina sp.]|tara:strand:+ start:16258 stop:17298 length:1041 start_codon:yes stop_codon:yes gene_type:complete
MKAAVLYETEKSLVIENGIEIPPLQAGQVLVKVAYSGICGSQLMEVKGKRGEDAYLPHLLGHEASGWVVDIGSNVTKVKPGDKVVLTWIKGSGADCKGAKYKIGNTTLNSGGVTTFSNYTVVSENRCVILEEGISMELAALLGCAVPTGAGIVFNTLRPGKDASIAIFGVGGIGLSAILGAKMHECSRIIAVDIEDKKLELAKEFGATDVINCKTENPVKKINQITKGQGIDYSIEAAGIAKVVESAFQSIKYNGGLCVIAGHPDCKERIQLDPFDLIRGKKIVGSWGGECLPDKDIPMYVKYYKNGKLPLERMISQVYPLEKINEALSELENGRAHRILIRMDHP